MTNLEDLGGKSAGVNGIFPNFRDQIADGRALTPEQRKLQTRWDSLEPSVANQAADCAHSIRDLEVLGFVLALQRRIGGNAWLTFPAGDIAAALGEGHTDTSVRGSLLRWVVTGQIVQRNTPNHLHFMIGEFARPGREDDEPFNVQFDDGR